MSQTIKSGNYILEVLRKRGILSPVSEKLILGFMKKWSVEAYRAVIETHCIEESRLADVLAEEFLLPRVARLRSRSIDVSALSYLSYADAMAFDMMPYAFDADEKLLVAIADPTQRDCVDQWIQSCGRPVTLSVAERSEIESSIQRHYPLSLQLPNTMASWSKGPCP